MVDNAQGLLQERTVAYRRFPAVAIFRAEVYPKLKDVLPADVWDYPAK